MENASKALIIAGAILISILLIGIGMFLYNAAQEPITSAQDQMSQQALRQFNQKFEKYGGSQKGSTVRSMISEVIASNAQETKNATGRTITVNSKSTANDIAGLADSINNLKSYTVKVQFNETTGAVNAITFE